MGFHEIINLVSMNTINYDDFLFIFYLGEENTNYFGMKTQKEINNQ